MYGLESLKDSSSFPGSLFPSLIGEGQTRALQRRLRSCDVYIVVLHRKVYLPLGIGKALKISL